MTDPCLDAEVLAAWADNALDARTGAEVESHASQCARCQAMLAAFARTEPAAAPSLVPELQPWWQSFRLRWLVPVAAAATAVAIWVALPSRPTPQAEVAGIPEPFQRQEADAARTARVDPEVSGATPPLAKEGAPAPREEAPAAREEAPRDAAAPDAELQDRAPLRPTLAERAVSTLQGFVSRDGAVRWRVAGATVERSTDSGATWMAASLAGAPSVNDADARGRAAAGAAAPATPGASVGAAAQAGAANAAGPARIVAGDAPSAAVCWFVGTRGAVWITADGGQFFRRLTVPGEPDLDAVTARDDRSADLTTSDGRVLRTIDAGASWMLIGP